MSRIVRSLSIIATLMIACLLPAAASAATKPHPAKKAHVAAVTRWASKHHLKGAWRKQDSDADIISGAATVRANVARGLSILFGVFGVPGKAVSRSMPP